MILLKKFGQHQPLNRQAERYAKEGVPISLSTMADQVGACCTALDPVFKCIQSHVLAAKRLHGDDTTVPVLARGKTDIGRIWVYVRDGRPFGDVSPPAALFHYYRDRNGKHPQTHLAAYSELLQADAFSGYAKLYDAGRKPGPITEAACWAQGRRKFFVLADIAQNARRRAHGRGPVFVAPMALQAVRRIDALFDIERDINTKPVSARLAACQEFSVPLVEELEVWMRQERTKLSRHDDVAKAMN